MPHLVEFTVVRNILLCDRAECAAFVDNDGTVIQLPADRQRNADNWNDVELRGFFYDSHQLYFRRFQKRFLQKQITAGIACDRKLRKAYDSHTFIRCFPDLFDDSVGIIHAVRDLEIRRCTGDLDESVFHVIPPKMQKRALKSSAPLLICYQYTPNAAVCQVWCGESGKKQRFTWRKRIVMI